MTIQLETMENFHFSHNFHCDYKIIRGNDWLSVYTER